ncbi:tetratricopeptide repeat protein [Occallatibacter riparius]|uniref:Tetratricopeptide repeat protein n=1 Tax=Occallatibacter riparius TaxID=1002689 RepID=A0A9J7BUK8_9BACT|nr:tetratricopeptide repeat protein [Occallatibacter riparius]UWZ85434.1 tetratricopeptide repeat protein [Occallatibacter riparius]
MESNETMAPPVNRMLQARHVYLMAALCLIAGLAIGYLVRAWRMPAAPVQARVVMPHPPMSGRRPSLEEMKVMADKQAAPLLAKLDKDEKNTDLLVQVGGIYHSAHQYKQAASYYDRAVAAKPSDVAIRTKLAASLFRMGDIDSAIDQLNQALSYDPKDANSLFNLGLIQWQGKLDGKSALATWQKLLKTNPQLAPERKAMVDKMIAEVKAHGHQGQ